jgi:hypothetical protein
MMNVGWWDRVTIGSLDDQDASFHFGFFFSLVFCVAFVLVFFAFVDTILASPIFGVKTIKDGDLL